MTSLIVYVGMASAALVGLLGWYIWRTFRPSPSFVEHPVIFFSVVFLAMLVLRWPLMNWAHEFSVDESQMLAQGMRFLSHPVPWHDVDGTTSGPLNSMFLSLPLLFGAPANWTTARTALYAANCLTLLFLYLALRCFGTRAQAQFVLLPAIFFYAFVSDRDFIHYSSETVPVLLLSAGIYFLSKEWCTQEPSRIRLFLLGLVSGSIPFAKLQAVPLALFLAAIGLLMIVIRGRKAGSWGRKFWQESAVICLGALVVPVLILGAVVASGAVNDFWKSYILASKSYASQESFLLKLRHVCFLFAAKSDFRSFAACLIGALGILFYLLKTKREKLHGPIFWALTVILADCALTVGCFIVAGKTFLHYTLLFVPALTMLLGLVFFLARAMLDEPLASEARSKPGSRAWLLVFVIFVAGLQCYKVPLFVHGVAMHILHGEAPGESGIAKYASEVVERKDSLSVWGWMPAYYIETGLTPATRDAIGHYVISKGPYQNYFRQRYLADLTRSRPALFIDAVAGNTFRWDWSDAEKHECFPELARFVDDNYSLWLSIQRTNQGVIGSPVRVYLLKERMTKLNLSPTNMCMPADTAYPLR